MVATTKAYLTKRAEDLGLVVSTEPDHMPAACDSCRKMQSCSQSTAEACGSNGPAAAAAGGSAAAAVMARERPPICGLVLVNDVIRAQMGALHTALQVRRLDLLLLCNMRFIMITDIHSVVLM